MQLIIKTVAPVVVEVVTELAVAAIITGAVYLHAKMQKARNKAEVA